MSSKKIEKNILVGLDIGTSKVVALVAEILPTGEPSIIGIGVQPSRGLKKGVIVNIDATVVSIQAAIEEAELMSGVTIRDVFTGIAGSHIRSLNSHGISAIKDSEVDITDIERVIDAAKAVAIPADQKILHILPQEFVIDTQDGIKDPIGMSGVRLEVRVHLITGAVSAAQNITKCVKQCKLDIIDMILEQLASSYAVLTEDEKELGVCLLDIGSGTTDIAVFSKGAIRHTAVIPIAGDQVTNDIAVAFRTPTHHAEKLKLEQGAALVRMADQNALFEVPSASDKPGRQASAKSLAEVMEARYEELFKLVTSELHRVGLQDAVPSGMVITGGAAQAKGLVQLAEGVLKMPVRLGSPQNFKGLQERLVNPAYSTSVGLLMYAMQQQEEAKATPKKRKPLFVAIKQWFSNNL